ncbi:MAG TPA: AraC family ligand binding domain-containing protein, partial [Candidatus Binataceae bacterium]
MVRTYAARHTGAYTIPEHTHDWSQLIYPQAGVIAVRTSAGSWIVPPERGVWVPRGVSHSIEIAGQTSMCSLYFPPGFAPRLPKECAVVAIPPLLRELILHANRIGTLHRAVPAHGRLIGVMLDQMRVLPQLPLDLPMPRDANQESSQQKHG